MVGKEQRHDFNRDLDRYLSTKESEDFGMPKKHKHEPAPALSEEDELKEYDGEKDSRSVFDRLLGMFGFSAKDPVEQEEVEQLEEAYGYEYDALEEKEESLQEEEQELEERKKGVLQRFVASLNGLFARRENWDQQDEQEVDRVEADEEKPDEMVVHDMKELGRITVHLLQEMTPNKRKAFKMSQQFETLKEILRRYRIIR